MPRSVEIARFKVRSDEGKEYIIIQYQDYVMDRNSSACAANIEGFKRMTTEEEYHIHAIDSDTFQIFETGETVKIILNQ